MATEEQEAGRALKPYARRVERGTGGRAVFDQRYGILDPPTPDLDWRLADLDAYTLDRIDPAGLINYLLDLSPEMSRALWDWLRFTNAGWEINAYNDSGEVDETAQAAIDAFLKRLEGYYGSVDVQFNRMFTAAYTRGAVLVELVLNEAGTEPVDLIAPDPYVVRFKRAEHEERGTYWQLGQWQEGEWVDLSDEPTVHYLPIDPMPDSPYGRAPAQPAIFTATFILGLLHDIRRVVAQQGYPRIDLSLDTEQLQAAMPADIAADAEKAEAWVAGIVAAVADAYANLEPDDAYIHTDNVTVNRPAGTLDASSLSAVDPIMRILERMIIRALKTMPVLAGVNEATTETHANRQWEIMVAGIKAIQHLVENALADLFGLALQAQGLQATVEVRFAELRASEILRDAMTEWQRIQNAKAKYDHGWVSQDAASEEITGEPADAEEPRASATGGAVFAPTVNETAAATDGTRQEEPAPIGGNLPLPNIPDQVVFTGRDVEQVAEEWDRHMPDYAGLIYARVEGGAEAHLPVDLPTDWQYLPDDREYVNDETGETVTVADAVVLRDLFLEAVRDAEEDRAMPATYAGYKAPTATRAINPGELARLVSARRISVQEWVTGMRQAVKESYMTEYALAKGGMQNMTFSDYGRVGRMLAPRGQYAHLQRFAEQIAEGGMSESAIHARSRLYINSSTQAYERGRAAVVGLIREMPAYPADGSMACLSNCRCAWEYEETPDEWRCFWRLDPGAEHCDDCLDNARRWNPLTISKARALTVEDLMRILPGVGDLAFAAGHGGTNGNEEG